MLEENLNQVNLDDIRTELNRLETEDYAEVKKILENEDVKSNIQEIETKLDDSLIIKITNNSNLETDQKLEIIDQLIKLGAKTDLIDERLGYNIIHYLMSMLEIPSDNIDAESIPQIIKMIIENNKALLNAKVNGMTPIAKAVEILSPALVEMLLNLGANPNDPAGPRISPVTIKRTSLIEEALIQFSSYSSKENALKIMSLLIQHKAVITKEIGMELWKRSNGLSLIQETVSRSVKFNYEDHKILLNYAIEHNNPDILPNLKFFGSEYLEFIVKQNKDDNEAINKIADFIGQEKQKGLNFISFLRKNHTIEGIEGKILDEEPWLNVQDENKHTALFRNICGETNIRITELLLKHGANPDVLVGNSSCLAQATHLNDAATVKLLLEQDADPNIDHNDPLTHAIYKINVEIVKLLLEYGANVSNKEYPTLYELAIREVNSSRKEIEAGNNESVTKLRDAKEIMQLLIEYGAEPEYYIYDTQKEAEENFVAKAPIKTVIKSYFMRQEAFSEYYKFIDLKNARKRADSKVRSEYYRENKTILTKMLKQQKDFDEYLPQNGLYKKYTSGETISKYKQAFARQVEKFNKNELSIDMFGKFIILLCSKIAKDSIYSEFIISKVKTFYAVREINRTLSSPEFQDIYNKVIVDKIKEEKNRKPFLLEILSNPFLHKLFTHYLNRRTISNLIRATNSVRASATNDQVKIEISDQTEVATDTPQQPEVSRTKESWVMRIGDKMEALAFGDIDRLLKRSHEPARKR
ncbi:MAG: ankyrin repeat domain-containing protein [Alphaproteobacteria bacterium]